MELTSCSSNKFHAKFPPSSLRNLNLYGESVPVHQNCGLDLSGQPLILQVNLGHYDVRRREEHSDGGDYSEESECYETEAVEHHCSKLPIVLDGSRVFVITNLGDGGKYCIQGDTSC